MSILYMKSINYVDAFSGCGGFRRGIEQAGIPIAWEGHSEIDKHAQSVYEYHYPESERLGDIRTIQPKRLPELDLFTFGSPCQDLSIAGKGRGLEGERSGLFYDAIKIIAAKKPKVFIWENVKGAFSSNGGRDFYQVLRTIADLGIYDIEWQLLNTRWFLPQNRERIYLVGHLRGSSGFKVFPFRETSSKAKNEIRKIMNEGGNHAGGGVFDKTGICPTLTSGGSGGSTNNCPKVIDKKGNKKNNQQYASTLTGGGHSGGNHSDMDLLVVPLKFLDRNQKNFQGEYANTVDTVNTSGIMLEQKIRRLTPVECERLQGFPDNWTKQGVECDISDTQRYKMIGNSVTTVVVQRIMERLYE